jgi:F-type H+-transporting ATPase subunit b
VDALGLNLPGLIVQFINFGILLFILWRFVLPPVQRMLDERRARIQESLEAAERMKAQATETERLLEEQREEGRRQAQQIIAQSQEIARRIENDARVQAQRDADALIVRARTEIQLERDQAIADLRREFADITVAAAEKVINQSLDRQAHRRLIDDVLSSLNLDSTPAR